MSVSRASAHEHTRNTIVASERLLTKLGRLGTRVAEVSKTSGGQFIPDNAKEKPLEATVVAVGTGKRLDDGIDHIILGEDDVLAILETQRSRATMAAKEIVFDIAARDYIANGLNILANAVKVTLGPRGRNVIIEKSWGAPTTTKDGVTEIELEDRFENIGAQMVSPRRPIRWTSSVASTLQ